MRYAFSGAQSTGKTTLVAELFKDERVIKADFQLKNNTTRNVLNGVFDIGKTAINEDGSDNTQLLICSQHLQNYVSGANHNVIYDRCALDSLVYTTYLFNHGKVRKETLRIAEAIYENLKYGVLFYIQPEIPLKQDGQRSVNKEFYDEIVQLFEDYFIQYRIHPFRLSGTVEERVKQVTDLIFNLKIKE